jgi:hypothetical protein
VVGDGGAGPRVLFPVPALQPAQMEAGRDQRPRRPAQRKGRYRYAAPRSRQEDPRRQSRAVREGRERHAAHRRGKHRLSRALPDHPPRKAVRAGQAGWRAHRAHRLHARGTQQRRHPRYRRITRPSRRVRGRQPRRVEARPRAPGAGERPDGVIHARARGHRRVEGSRRHHPAHGHRAADQVRAARAGSGGR